MTTGLILIGLGVWLVLVALVLLWNHAAATAGEERPERDEQNARLRLHPEPRNFDSLHRPRVGIDNEKSPGSRQGLRGTTTS